MALPALPVLLAPIAGLFFREFVIRFFVFGALFLLLKLLSPILMEIAAPYLTGVSLSNALASVPSSVLFFMHAFALDVGIPAVISAYVARFSVRRLPVIG